MGSNPNLKTGDGRSWFDHGPISEKASLSPRRVLVHTYIHVFMCTRVCLHTHTHPWQCFSASSPGHCLPSPEPPSVSPGNWCLVPGPLSFVHQGLHGQLCSSLEVSRVPSLLSPETGAWLCLAQGQEEEDLRSYFPTQHYVTLVKSPHSSAPHF